MRLSFGPPVAITLLATVCLGCSSGSTSISWEEAESSAGERATVCGPLVSARYDPESAATFLNIGADYPSPDRFTIVLWNSDRGERDTFRDVTGGREVCGSGEVSLFKGTAQMQLSSISDVSVSSIDDEEDYPDAVPGQPW